MMTPEQERKVREGWNAGLSSGVIADQIGMSRSAVMGKVRRLGLASRGESGSHPVRRKRYDNSRRAALAAIKRASECVAAKIVEPPPMPMVDDEIALEQRKTLVELTNETCRWPVGDPHEPGFFFCGNPSADNQAGRPYCPWHTNMARGSAYTAQREEAA